MRKSLACFSLVFCLLTPFFLHAADAKKTTKPATQKFFLDDVEVIAIEDLPNTIDISLFSGPATDEVRKKYMPEGSAKASVNVFAVRMAGETFLVDAGYGFLNPKSGLMAALADLGIRPDMVNKVLLTHMHPDHIGGLITEKGERVFPKAEIQVSQGEQQFWVEKATDDKSTPVSVAKAYGKDMKIFLPGAEIVPGITAIEAPGHTPGHTAFLLRAGEGLLFVGDIVHAAALQFPLPDECARYDQDTEMAIRARKAVLFLAAANRLAIAGAHIPFPGIGKVENVKGGGFNFKDGFK